MIMIEHAEELKGGIVTVTVKGHLDSETSFDFEEYVNQLIERGRRFLVLDAGGLEYVSSQGIGVMLYLHKKISAAKGICVFCNLRDEIRTLGMILGLDKVLAISPSRDEAFSRVIKHQELGAHAEAAEEMPGEVAVQIIEEEEKESHESASAGPEARSGEQAEPIPAKGDFESPLIVECAECKTLIRVQKSGDYICPECHTEFYVEADQTVIF